MIADRTEASATFACFGATCGAYVIGEGPRGAPAAAVAAIERSLLRWHRRFTRFEASSELSRLNADPRAEVPVSPMMARFAEAVVAAAQATDGLVDATLLGELAAAGYRADLPRTTATATAPHKRHAAPPRPAGPHPERRWRTIEVDHAAGTIRRPPGLRLDGGGLLKGLFADVLARRLADHAAFAVDCAGDLRLGGARQVTRAVRVPSPLDDSVLHTFRLTAGGVATSGIGRRRWRDAAGRPAHHLLDPATGRPAFTGLIQVTALAPTALEAEVRAKAALLSGPDGARAWLPDGGVLVADDGGHEVVAAR